MNDDSSVPQNPRTGGSAKQGAAIGGWICFGLGALIMYWSVWAFILYGPLFFVAFVLSIVAMAQRRIVLGIALLLATIVIPLMEWFALAANRTNKFLDTQINLLSTPTPASSVVDHTQSQLNTSSTRSQAPSERHESATADDQALREQILREPIESMHAWQLQVAYSGSLAENALTAPSYSPDGESIIFAQRADNAVRIAIYRLRDHTLVKSWQPLSIPTSLAWSPDGNRVAYKTESGLRVVDLATAKDVPLPINGFFGFPRDRFAWLPSNKLICPAGGGYGTLTLDLDSLQTQSQQSQASDSEALSGGKPHPYCKVAQGQIGNAPYLFVSEVDGSYSHPLLERFFAETPFFVSSDLRNIIVSQNNAFTHLLLGGRPATELNYQIDLDVRDGSNCNNCAGSEKYLEAGVPFWGDVCAPSTNPLNGKVIGPDPNAFKGRVRVTKWGNRIATVRVALEIKPIKEGDIVFNIQSEQWGQFGNWAWKFPDVWRVLNATSSSATSEALLASTPDPSVDVSNNRPLPDSKRRSPESDSSRRIIGTWRKGEETVTYNNDGSGNLLIENHGKADFAWTIDGEALTLTFKAFNGVPYPQKVVNRGRLKDLTDSEYKWVNYGDGKVLLWTRIQ